MFIKGQYNGYKTFLYIRIIDIVSAEITKNEKYGFHTLSISALGGKYIDEYEIWTGDEAQCNQIIEALEEKIQSGSIDESWNLRAEYAAHEPVRERPRQIKEVRIIYAGHDEVDGDKPIVELLYDDGSAQAYPFKYHESAPQSFPPQD